MYLPLILGWLSAAFGRIGKPPRMFVPVMELMVAGMLVLSSAWVSLPAMALAMAGVWLIVDSLARVYDAATSDRS